MREFVVETLDQFGAESEVVAGGCVLAKKYSDAPGEGPHLVLNTHLDTVTPHVPFERGEAHEDERADSVSDDGPGDVIRGRGACDAKGPLAALLSGFLAADPERGRITLALTRTRSRCRSVRQRSPGARPGPKTGSTATCSWSVSRRVSTPAPPQRGGFRGPWSCREPPPTPRSSRERTQSRPPRARSRRSGPSTTAPTNTRSSARRSSRRPSSRAAAQRIRCPRTVRSPPIDGVSPGDSGGFRSSLADAVRESTPKDIGVAVALTDRESPFFEAFSTDPDHELVGAVANAARIAADSTGILADRGGAVRPFGAATEASYFAPAPTVVFGPGDLADNAGAVAHAEREYVRVREVEAAAKTVERSIAALLGDAGATAADDAV